MKIIPKSPKSVPFPMARPPQSTWDEVIARSPGPIELRTLITGTQQTTLAKLMAGPARDGSVPTGAYRSFVIAFVLKHPKFGDILIDTGLDSSFGSNPFGNLKGLLVKLMLDPMEQSDGESFEDHLEKLSIRPSMVLMTHLHIDHTAGLNHIPRQTPVIIGPREGPTQYWPLFSAPHFESIDHFKEIRLEDGIDIEPLGRSFDILGDGTLWAILTPGHTKGHLSFFVLSTEGPVFIVGDACHTKWGFDHDAPPAFSSNVKGAIQTMDRIKEFSRRYPDVRLIFGHDRPNGN